MGEGLGVGVLRLELELGGGDRGGIEIREWGIRGGARVRERGWGRNKGVGEGG